MRVGIDRRAKRSQRWLGIAKARATVTCETEVKAQATLVSYAGLERYREGYPGRPKVYGKIAQL